MVTVGAVRRVQAFVLSPQCTWPWLERRAFLAVLLMCFAMGCRSAEVIATPAGAGLRVRDVHALIPSARGEGFAFKGISENAGLVVTHDGHWAVLVEGSKMDQTRQGFQKALGRIVGEDLCPANALHLFLRVRLFSGGTQAGWGRCAPLFVYNATTACSYKWYLSRFHEAFEVVVPMLPGVRYLPHGVKVGTDAAMLAAGVVEADVERVMDGKAHQWCDTILAWRFPRS